MKNFTVKEVKAYSKAEAIENAPFKIIKGSDCTRAWELKNNPTGADLDEFMEEQLAKKTKHVPGLGCYITITSGVPDTKERPYSITDTVNDKGARKFEKAILLVDENNTIKEIVKGTKQQALDAARRIYKTTDFKGSLTAYIVHVVKDGGVSTVFTTEYAPSKGTTLGTYKFFGVPVEE